MGDSGLHGVRGIDSSSPGRHASRPNYMEGTQPHPSAENWIKDLLSIAPPIRVRLSLPHSQYLPSGSFHKPLILKHQRPNRMKATITEKKTKPKKLEKKKKN